MERFSIINSANFAVIYSAISLDDGENTNISLPKAASSRPTWPADGQDNQFSVETGMKPTPSDWPRLSSSVFYQDAAAAIDWLCDAFGFAVRLKVEGDNGRIEHSELTYGEGLIMVGQESPDSERLSKRSMRSPQSLDGACTQTIMFFVDDAETHCAHSRSRGARIVEELATHDYGED